MGCSGDLMPSTHLMSMTTLTAHRISSELLPLFSSQSTRSEPTTCLLAVADRPFHSTCEFSQTSDGSGFAEPITGFAKSGTVR